MRTNNISFPNPVLGISDDVNGSISSDCSIKLDPIKTTLTVKWNLTCDSLQLLINQEKAAYCVEVICPGTIYRKCFQTHDSTQEISLDSALLRGRTVLNHFIAATENIPNYFLKEFNTDYEGYLFDVGKGDMLAWSGSESFTAEKSWEALKSVSSFMVVKKGPLDKGPMAYDLDDEKIIIYLSKEDFKKYENIGKTPKFSDVFLSVLVLPALTNALKFVLSEDQTCPYSERSWFINLKIRINEESFKQKFNMQLTIDKSLEVAQAILDYPISKTISGLDYIITGPSRSQDED
jgi:hypothetical protein